MKELLDERALRQLRGVHLRRSVAVVRDDRRAMLHGSRAGVALVTRVTGVTAASCGIGVTAAS